MIWQLIKIFDHQYFCIYKYVSTVTRFLCLSAVAAYTYYKTLSGTVPSAEGCVWTAEGAVKKKRENCSGKVFSINVLLSCNSSLFACVPLL